MAEVTRDIMNLCQMLCAQIVKDCDLQPRETVKMEVAGLEGRNKVTGLKQIYGNFQVIVQRIPDEANPIGEQVRPIQ